MMAIRSGQAAVAPRRISRVEQLFSEGPRAASNSESVDRRAVASAVPRGSLCLRYRCRPRRGQRVHEDAGDVLAILLDLVDVPDWL